MRNPVERGVRVVLFSNAEKLNSEHHLVDALAAFITWVTAQTNGQAVWRVGVVARTSGQKEGARTRTAGNCQRPRLCCWVGRLR